MSKSDIVAAVIAWERVALRHRKVGACDTEPQSLFQWTLYHAAKNLPYLMPRTPDEWQLYDHPNAAQAAVELTKALADCIEIINVDPADSLRFLKNYCWRVTCTNPEIYLAVERANSRMRRLEKENLQLQNRITELESELQQSKVNND